MKDMKVPYSHGEGSCLFACMKSLSGWAGPLLTARVESQGCSVVVYLGPPQLPSKISQIPTIEGHKGYLKGPLGVLVGGLGLGFTLFSCCWGRRSGLRVCLFVGFGC